MAYCLVLQFPMTSVDFETLIAIEDSLIEQIPREHVIDGHDFGSGEGNIFVITEQPKKAFQLAKTILDQAGHREFRAAFRDCSGEDYTVLWPTDLKDFSVQ